MSHKSGDFSGHESGDTISPPKKSECYKKEPNISVARLGRSMFFSYNVYRKTTVVIIYLLLMTFNNQNVIVFITL